MNRTRIAARSALALLLLAATPLAAQTIVSDTFAGNDGDSISSHTP